MKPQVVLAAFLFIASSVSAERDPDRSIDFGLSVEGGLSYVKISLPATMNFARGGPVSLKDCETCPEPNEPEGLVFLLGGSGELRFAQRFRFAVGVLLPILDADYRSGFTDRRRWPAPGEGEAYTYSRVSDLDPIGYASFGIFFKGSNAHEIGVKAERLKVTIEQGYDRFNARDPRRSVDADGTAWIVYYRWTTALQRGPFFSVEVIPVGDLDFQGFGNGDTAAATLSGGFRF